jgi:hypothetical protein
LWGGGGGVAAEGRGGKEFVRSARKKVVTFVCCSHFEIHGFDSSFVSCYSQELSEMNPYSESKAAVVFPLASQEMSKESAVTFKPVRGSMTSFADSGFKGLSIVARSVLNRDRKVAYDVLDVMDFGVNGRSGFPSPTSANLVIRRNDSKENRKRWNAEKVQPTRVRASSESLCQVLAPYQPSLAVIVGRAQLGFENIDQGRLCRRKNLRQG